MANDTDVNSLQVRNASNSDYLIGTVDGRASRVKVGNLTSSFSQWSNIQNKPFDSIAADDFSITVNMSTGKSTLGISNPIKANSHLHINKSVLDKFSENNETGVLLYNGLPVKNTEIEWNNITDKPFASISEDHFTVAENELQLSENIRNELHTHLNKDIIDKFGKNSDGKLLYDGQPIESDGGLDFQALSDSLTGGTLSGITITPSMADRTFDITVDADSIMQNISINDEGFWVINGEATTVSGKGTDGKNGKDGVTPTINSTNYHWMIGETDTGVTAKGSDGYSPIISLTNTANGIKVIVTDKDGTSQTADILNGADGKDGVTTIQTAKKDIICTLSASAWTDTVPYSQTVSAAGITADLNPRIDVIISEDLDTGTAEERSYSFITRAVTGDGTITAYCYEQKPAVDLNIMVEVI